MSGSPPVFFLSCPTCGKRYQGDPYKPEGRYLCPTDNAVLVREGAERVGTGTIAEPPITQRVTQEIKPSDLPPSPRVTQEIKVPIGNPSPEQDAPIDFDKTRVFGSTGKGAPDSAAAQVTRPMGSGKASASGSTSSVSESRRSVLAMLKGTGTQSLAAMDHEKYEMRGTLGQGGVGQVLKVLDRDLKREVAMKTLISQQLASEDALVRFVEEAQATGQLEHPNIVPVHDLGVDGDGRVYFTLKYVQGASLKRVIRGRDKDDAIEDGDGTFREHYTPLRMVEILVSICQAVAYAHNKGIIHRDLKPDNVMLGKYGEVLVMDWGLAKVLGKTSIPGHDDTVRITTTRAGDESQNTVEGSIAGTPAYMSPEQASGKISEINERTDIYALGAILYEILSGHPPYEGAGALELVKQVVEGGPRPLKANSGSHGFNPIPRELKAICEKAMARSPHDRYQSAELLRDDLQAFLENLPVSASPDTAVQRAIKWVKRNRRQVQTSAISAAVVIAVLLGGWYGYRQWTISSLLKEGKTKLNAARDEYKSAQLENPKQTNNDSYAQQMYSSAMGDKIRVFRQDVNTAMDPLRRVLDMDPQNSRGRLLLAESYMELWRRAIEEDNIELARSHRRDVERYAPEPSPFAAELSGFGALSLAFEPPDAESYLFSFEMLRSKDKAGRDLPARLIPVPYDPVKRQADKDFIKAEQDRIAKGTPLPEARHSVFNLEPTPASKLGKGSIVLSQLPPGSYMILAKAPEHAEVRVPFKMNRNGTVQRKIELPKTEEMPPGFFYMAGGEVIVGGTTAGAPAVHPVTVPASFVYHDEISMAEYAAFLRDLVKTGKAAEARQRLPKDFGKNLATLSSAGELMPADQSDPVNFAKSPVRGVSFNDAMAYVTWRSKQDGLAYRLPKEWEWESACRGADGRTYSWGNTPGKGLAVVTQGYGDTGNNISWKWEDYKDESPWGVHNMAGGAAEWTMTLFAPKAAVDDPVFGQYAIRGNAWALPPTGLECAFRTSGQPDYFHPTIGFRLALDYPVKRIGPVKEGAAQIMHSH